MRSLPTLVKHIRRSRGQRDLLQRLVEDPATVSDSVLVYLNDAAKGNYD